MKMAYWLTDFVTFIKGVVKVKAVWESMKEIALRGFVKINALRQWYGIL